MLQVDKDLNQRSYATHNLMKLHRAWPLTQEEDGAPLSVGLGSGGLMLPARRICLAFCKHRPDMGFSQGVGCLLARTA